MSAPDPWEALDAELALWQADGIAARLWLRDDDTIEPTPALDRLTGLTGQFRVPLLLAVVPAGATPELARLVATQAHVAPAQHGWAHRNHTPAGEKAAELGLQRSVREVVAELRMGRERMRELFGERLCPVLVPPWNRIGPDVLAWLPDLGFTAVSRFGWKEGAFREINCHVDIIDWKATRQGHEHGKLVSDLVEALAIARRRGGAPVGILAHHLVHGEKAWSFLETLFRHTCGGAALRWASFDEILAG